MFVVIACSGLSGKGKADTKGKANTKKKQRRLKKNKNKNSMPFRPEQQVKITTIALASWASAIAVRASKVHVVGDTPTALPCVVRDTALRYGVWLHIHHAQQSCRAD